MGYEMREYRINRERYIRTGDARAFARMLDHVTIPYQDLTIPELRGNRVNLPPKPGSVDYWSRGTPPLAPGEFIDEGNWWKE